MSGRHRKPPPSIETHVRRVSYRAAAAVLSAAASVFDLTRGFVLPGTLLAVCAIGYVALARASAMSAVDKAKSSSHDHWEI